MIIRKTILLSILGMLALTVPAQELGEVAFRQALLDLQTDLRLMCVAAHPDDEDGATLAYYRMLHGVETHAVIATRGEGGQNELGSELYNELGVIRSREMAAAAKIEGATLHFLNLPEFGYSKSIEETFDIWGKDVAMERMVRVIRETRPHVIITNHGRMQDHGHHQAIGLIVQEAFDLAGDPEKFPEHLRAGLEPWQPLRLYIRDFRGGEGTTPNDIATLEPVRGMTIAEIAASALEVHKSQGMRFFIDLLLSSQPMTYYHPFSIRRGKSGTPLVTRRGPLFEGLPYAESAERPQLPSRWITRAEAKEILLPWLKEHDSFREGSFEEKKRWATANRAALLATELRMQIKLSDEVVTAGQAVEVTAQLVDFGDRDSIEVELKLEEQQGLGDIGSHRIQAPMHKTGSALGNFKFKISPQSVETLPLAPRLFSPDFLVPQLVVEASVNCGDAILQMDVPVYVDVASPLSITCPDAPYLIQKNDVGPMAVRLLVTNNFAGPLAEYLSLSVPPGWESSPERLSVSLDSEGAQRYVSFTVTPPAELEQGDVQVFAQVIGRKNSEEVTLRVADLVVPENINVGVIQSYDDTFARTLETLSVPYELIEPDDFLPERLDAFTSIIVDIRAYQYRPDLVANNVTVLDYVERGGTLLVMYQKTFDWNVGYAPYPISLSRNRVTREDAPMEILVPDHPLFTTPNRIAQGDWADWIQERGLYFPETWNEAYTPLIATTDPGEEIPPGSYLVAQHGKGNYVYTALGWYRQLRELHPGALRCFANMLALGHETNS